MTSSQYYVERHIDRFYQILFFFMELKLYGIQLDEDDIWDGSLPYEVMPSFIQKIVYCDLSYQNFLLLERNRLKKILNKAQIEISQSLLSARVCEDGLFTALNLWFLSIMPNNGTVSTTSASTVTFYSPQSTTPKYDKFKRKGSVRVNDEGKHFSKRSRNNFSESCCDYGYENNGGRESRMHTESCLRQRYNYTVSGLVNYALSVCSMILTSKLYQQQLIANKRFYGCIVDSIDQQFSFEKDLSTFVKTLTDTFVTLGKSNLFQNDLDF